MGRPKVGRMRPLRFPLNLSSDEREYLVRYSHAASKNGFEITQSSLITEAVFTNGWLEKLHELRETQKNEKIKMPMFKRKIKRVPKCV